MESVGTDIVVFKLRRKQKLTKVIAYGINERLLSFWKRPLLAFCILQNLQ